MDYQEYVKKKNEMYECFMHYIDEDTNVDENFADFNDIIKKHGYLERSDEFKLILYLIREINKNHRHSFSQLDKIERFLTLYIEYIKQSFTNDELSDIFKRNPQILLFLLKNVDNFDYTMIKLIYNTEYPQFFPRVYKDEAEPDPVSMMKKYEKEDILYKYYFLDNYKAFFFPYLEEKLDETERADIKEQYFRDQKALNKLEEKVRKGENGTFICQLIQNDSVEEFISYVTQKSINLSSKVNKSDFEMNPLLIKKRAKLIEYAAFFGSVKIFKYLQMNEVELTPSLWLYSIHGNSPTIIHLLEENGVKPEDETYAICLKEAIKCHNNNIVEYIQSNLIDENNKVNFRNNLIGHGFHYYNYQILHHYSDINKFIFPLFYACRYDYLQIVELLIKNKKAPLNQAIIQNSIFIQLHSTF